LALFVLGLGIMALAGGIGRGRQEGGAGGLGDHGRAVASIASLK